MHFPTAGALRPFSSPSRRPACRGDRRGLPWRIPCLVTSFGEGIAAADSHGYIPEITRTLWVVALLGTLAGAVTLTLLVMGGTFLLLKIYGVTWIWLIGCFVAGNLIYTGGSKTTIVVGLVDLVLPVASIILAWWAISTPHSPRNATE